MSRRVLTLLDEVTTLRAEKAQEHDARVLESLRAESLRAHAVALASGLNAAVAILSGELGRDWGERFSKDYEDITAALSGVETFLSAPY